jgi:hypothetical protein
MFEGVAQGTFLESYFNTLADYEQMGFHRVGAPEIGEPTVTVTGGRATAVMCVDQRAWGGRHNGEPVDPPKVAASATKLTLSRREAGWIVVDSGVAAKGGGDSCG